ncbi:MAG: HlyD family efflux transporter periplasmic adaptor subunit [Myxococcota bacterium]
MKPLPSKAPAAELATMPGPGMDQPRASRSRIRSPVTITIATLAAVVVMVFTYRVSLRGTARASVGGLSEVELTRFSESIPLTGTVVAETAVALGSVDGGRVSAIHVENGDRVEADQKLVSLQNRELELAVMTREALFTEQLSHLARTRATVDHSVTDYDRDLLELDGEINVTADRLKRRRPLAGVSQPEEVSAYLEMRLASLREMRVVTQDARRRAIDTGRADVARLRHSVERMAEGLNLLRQSLSEATIRAPISGRLSGLNARVGDIVTPGARLGLVSVEPGYLIEARVDEFYLGRIAVGQRMESTVVGESISLTVASVDPDVKDRFFEIELAFEGHEPTGLRLGQSVELRAILSATKQLLTVANGPFIDQTGGRWAFVAPAQGDVAFRRDVVFGRRDTDRIEVLDGVVVGERVLVSSYESILGAEQVRLVGSERRRR